MLQWLQVRKTVSPTVVEIMGPKYIGVMTLTFLGHVTSSVTWPFESQWVISYWWSIGPKSLSLTDSEIFCLKHHVPIGTMLNRHCACAISRDIISHVTIRIPICHFVLVFHRIQVSISDGFRDIVPQTSCSHRHNPKSSLRMRDITWRVKFRLCKI